MGERPTALSMWRETFRRYVEIAIATGEWTPPPGVTVDDVIASIKWGAAGTQVLIGEPHADGRRGTLTIAFKR